MKFGILLFACMALINFAKVSAIDNVDGAGQGEVGQGGAGQGIGGRGRGGRGRGGRGRGVQHRPNTSTHPEVGAMDNVDRARQGGAAQSEGSRRRGVERRTHPDLPRYALYPHNHPIDVQNPVPDNPRLASKGVVISKIVNRMPAHWHLLMGELLPNSNITLCNSPYGYVVVNLYDGNLLYACPRPAGSHNETVHREHVSSGAPEFLAVIKREGMPVLEGVLTTGNARITLNTMSSSHTLEGLRPSGYVRYVKYDQYNADGFIYQFNDRES